MIERTLIRIAIAAGAAWWLARVVFSRAERRKLDAARRALNRISASAYRISRMFLPDIEDVFSTVDTALNQYGLEFGRNHGVESTNAAAYPPRSNRRISRMFSGIFTGDSNDHDRRFALVRTPMTVAELIAVLQTLPLDVRVIVQGYESGFNDAAGAMIQPVVVNGNHRARPGLGGATDIPADFGSGDHEEPGSADFESEVIEQAVFITSTRTQPVEHRFSALLKIDEAAIDRAAPPHDHPTEFISLADALAQHGDDADFEFDAPRI